MMMLGALLFTLPAIDPVLPPASRVTLSGTHSLEKHVASLARQVNAGITLDLAVKDRVVPLDIRAEPFWSALERIAEAADHRLVISNQGLKIALKGQGPERYRRTPVHMAGPFRTSVKRTVARLDLETGQRRLEVQVEIVWEPRFKAFYAQTLPNAFSAGASSRQELSVLATGSSKIPISGQAVEVTVRLADVPRTLQELAVVNGFVTFAGTEQLLLFSFAADAVGPATAQRQSGVTARLDNVLKRSRIWTAIVHFEYPKSGPEFESFQSFLLDNECWLLRPDGTRFASTGFEVGSARGGAIPVHYHFQENSKTGFTIDQLRGWKLSVRTPGPIVEVPLRFTLKDIPLP